MGYLLIATNLGWQFKAVSTDLRHLPHLQGDAVLISPQSVALVSMQSFSERRLYQALNVDGVESASPVYLDYTLWRNPQTRLTRNIFIIGLNPAERVLDLPGVQQNLENIKIPDVVLFDEASRTDFGSIAADFNQGKVIITEVVKRRISVGGLFNLGPTFRANGTLITSDLNFIRVLPERKIGRASLVLALTILMCLISGALAMRKLQSADPADLF